MKHDPDQNAAKNQNRWGLSWNDLLRVEFWQSSLQQLNICCSVGYFSFFLLRWAFFILKMSVVLLLSSVIFQMALFCRIKTKLDALKLMWKRHAYHTTYTACLFPHKPPLTYFFLKICLFPTLHFTLHKPTKHTINTQAKQYMSTVYRIYVLEVSLTHLWYTYISYMYDVLLGKA